MSERLLTLGALELARLIRDRQVSSRGGVSFRNEVRRSCIPAAQIKPEASIQSFTVNGTP